MTANNIAPIISERLLFRLLLRKVEQQWVQLYCTDVGSGRQKRFRPLYFRAPGQGAAGRGEYCQAARAFAEAVIRSEVIRHPRLDPLN